MPGMDMISGLKGQSWMAIEKVWVSDRIVCSTRAHYQYSLDGAAECCEREQLCAAQYVEPVGCKVGCTLVALCEGVILVWFNPRRLKAPKTIDVNKTKFLSDATG